MIESARMLLERLGRRRGQGGAVAAASISAVVDAASTNHAAPRRAA